MTTSDGQDYEDLITGGAVTHVDGPLLFVDTIATPTNPPLLRGRSQLCQIVFYCRRWVQTYFTKNMVVNTRSLPHKLRGRLA